MELIPFPLHIAALVALWIYAGIRGGPFPFKLVSVYSAFFILCAGSNELVISNHLDYSVQILTQFITTLFLFEIADQAPRLKYIKRFCALMILSIINYTFMFLSYLTLDGLLYDVSIQVYDVVSLVVSVAVVWILIGVINGSNSGDRVLGRLWNFIIDGLLHFRLHKEALPASIWQTRTQNSSRAAEQ